MVAQRKNLLGQILVDRYELCGLIGSGAMGSVYQAIDRQRQGMLCAIKVLHLGLEVQSDSYSRFLNEAQIAAQLFHPNIVEAHELREACDGTPFIVMELLQGQDLHGLLSRVKQLSWQRTLNIVRQVGSALHAAHSLGIIHRDVKPKNVFVCQPDDGNGRELIKVVDFGLSKILDRGEQFTTIGLIMGTPEYLSPEATCGDSRQIDAFADQWALGVMAYRMLAGRLPFESPDFVEMLMKIRHESPPPLRQLVPDAPESLILAIERAMSKQKEDRFPSILELVRACSDSGMRESRLSGQLAPPVRAFPSLPQTTRPATVSAATASEREPLLPSSAPSSVPSLPRVHRPQGSRLLMLSGPLWGIAGLVFVHWGWSAARGAREQARQAQSELRTPVTPTGPIVAPAPPPPPPPALAPSWMPEPPRPAVPPLDALRIRVKRRAEPPRPGATGLSLAAQTPPLPKALPEFATSGVLPPAALSNRSLSGLSLEPRAADPPAENRAGPQLLHSAPPKIRGDVHLSARARFAHRGSQVDGQYQLCIAANGRVTSVKVLRAIPLADDDIVTALRSWVFVPAPQARCFKQELSFIVE